MSEPPSLDELNSALTVPLIVGMWSTGGFAAKQPRIISPSSWPHSLGCEYIFCKGDVCEKHTFFLPLSPAKENQDRKPLIRMIVPAQMAPDARLLYRIFLQPISILAISGMALLTWCCLTHNAYSDALLSIIGGRSYGWPLLIAGHFAHFVEASIAIVSLVQGPHRLPLTVALRWAFPTVFVGFPALQWALELNKAGDSSSKRK
mmetsp:Transcript_70589/g.138767  ORF Transcript_70589/g.138767 Transcript_70589/m.138767 type:complete len:204 (-) Transcript_70589:355-966(-)